MRRPSRAESRAKKAEAAARLTKGGQRLLITRTARRLELAGDRVEGRAQIGTDGRRSGDDRDGDERGDQAVFDCRRTRVVGKQLLQKGHGSISWYLFVQLHIHSTPVKAKLKSNTSRHFFSRESVLFVIITVICK